MVTQRVKEKLFRLTPENENHVNTIIQYAYKINVIAKPSFQDFMLFAIQCADSVLKQHWEESKQPHRRRPIV